MVPVCSPPVRHAPPPCPGWQRASRRALLAAAVPLTLVPLVGVTDAPNFFGLLFFGVFMSAPFALVASPFAHEALAGNAPALTFAANLRAGLQVAVLYASTPVVLAGALQVFVLFDLGTARFDEIVRAVAGTAGLALFAVAAREHRRAVRDEQPRPAWIDRGYLGVGVLALAVLFDHAGEALFVFTLLAPPFVALPYALAVWRAARRREANTAFRQRQAAAVARDELTSWREVSTPAVFSARWSTLPFCGGWLEIDRHGARGGGSAFGLRHARWETPAAETRHFLLTTYGVAAIDARGGVSAITAGAATRTRLRRLHETLAAHALRLWGAPENRIAEV